MEVREGMSDLVLTVGPGHTLREAARMMTEKGVGAAVVIDEEAPGPRVISERDVLISVGRGEDPDEERVGDHMSGSIITASPGLEPRARRLRDGRAQASATSSSSTAATSSASSRCATSCACWVIRRRHVVDDARLSDAPGSAASSGGSAPGSARRG